MRGKSKRSRRLSKEFMGYIVVALFIVIAMEVVKSRHWGYGYLLKCSPKYQIYFESRAKEFTMNPEGNKIIFLI